MSKNGGNRALPLNRHKCVVVGKKKQVLYFKTITNKKHTVC